MEREQEGTACGGACDDAAAAEQSRRASAATNAQVLSRRRMTMLTRIGAQQARPFAVGFRPQSSMPARAKLPGERTENQSITGPDASERTRKSSSSSRRARSLPKQSPPRRCT